MRKSELRQLAKLAASRPGASAEGILNLICELLDMDSAYAATVDGPIRTIRAAVLRDRPTQAGQPKIVGTSAALAETWCGEILRRGGLLAPDVLEEPALVARSGGTGGLRSFAGAVLRAADGTARGVVGSASMTTHPTLNQRDLALLEVLGEVLLPMIEVVATPAPAAPVTVDLAAVADVLVGAGNLEELTRPLLNALHDLSGIATTYLTTIRMDEGFQEIRYVANDRPDAPYAVPEGALIPWDMSLCKRSLEDGVPFSTDLAHSAWSDNIAVQMLNLRTFMSVPVELADGRLWGTLCASDDQLHHDAGQHVPTLRLFARLIAAELDRSQALERAQLEARTDQLTGCSTRRVVEPWITTALAAVQDDEVVALLFVDVDQFKSVNDGFGHARGDEILAAIGENLRRTSRAGDLVARLGGDEFLLGARLPRTGVSSLAARVRAAAAASYDDLEVRCSVGIATSDDVATPVELLALADSRMYVEKSASTA